MESKQTTYGKFYNSVCFERKEYPWVKEKKEKVDGEANTTKVTDVQTTSSRFDLAVAGVLTIHAMGVTGRTMTYEILARTLGWRDIKKNHILKQIKESLQRLGVVQRNASGVEKPSDQFKAKELWLYDIGVVKAFKEGAANLPAHYVIIKANEMAVLAKMAGKQGAHIKLPVLLMMLMFIKVKMKTFQDKNEKLIGVGGFITLGQLSDELGISTTTIRKLIRNLEEEGIFQTTFFTAEDGQRSPLAFMREKNEKLEMHLESMWVGKMKEDLSKKKKDSIADGVNAWQQKRNRLNRKSQIGNSQFR